MAQRDSEGAMQARILYWGAEGAGKSANLRTIHAKLRSDHRGELRAVPTRIDPTVTYETLPIELGEVRGVPTRLLIVAVPGAEEQAPTRKQLLDQVDGVVLVVDSRRECIEADLASFEELRQALAAYGRRLDALPVVVQYNKVDLADPGSLDELHRKLDLPHAAVFETVATEGAGALRTLTTISKRVMRVLREEAPEAPAPAPAHAEVTEPIAEPLPEPMSELEPLLEEPAEAVLEAEPLDGPALMEEAILAEGEEPEEALAAESMALDTQQALDRPWEEVSKEESGALRLGPDVRIVDVGRATRVDDRSVRVDLVLTNDAGETGQLALTVSIDPWTESEEP